MKPISLNQKDQAAIQDFRQRLIRLLGQNLKKLALFGSKAEGKDTRESDIDILVLVKDSALDMREKILDAAFEVNLEHGVYISPRVIPLSIFQHPVWRITSFMKHVREKGVTL